MTNFCPQTHEENERNILDSTRDWIRNGVEIRDETCPTTCSGPIRVPLKLLGIEVPFLTDRFECPNPSKRSTEPGEFEIV